jgi:hypothetical protein
MSEPAIVSGIAHATFGHDPHVDWLGLADDYDAIRDLIARVFPGFEDYNDRVRVPGGFRLPVGADGAGVEDGQRQGQLPAVQPPRAAIRAKAIRT